MAVSLTRIPWLWWGSKEKEGVSSGSSVNSVCDWGLDNLKFSAAKVSSSSASSSSSSSPATRKVRRKWKSREERRRVDKEYDIVLVPSDGVCLSGSESDDSDWSIGWLEPHAPDFQSDDGDDHHQRDDSFAVLVPCYKHDHQGMQMMEPKDPFFTSIKNLPTHYSPEGKKYMEQWLSSLQDF